MHRWKLLISLCCAAGIVLVLWFISSQNPEEFAKNDPLAWFWQKIEQRWGMLAGLRPSDASLSGTDRSGTGTTVTTGNAVSTSGDITDTTWDIARNGSGFEGSGGGDSGDTSAWMPTKLPTTITSGTLTVDQYARLVRDMIWYTPATNLLMQRCNPWSSLCKQFFVDAKQLVFADGYTWKFEFLPLFVQVRASEDKDLFTLFMCVHDALTGTQWQSFAEAFYRQEWMLTQDRVVKTAQTLGVSSVTASCISKLETYAFSTRFKNAFLREVFGEIQQVPFHVLLNTTTRNWMVVPGIYDDRTMYAIFDAIW